MVQEKFTLIVNNMFRLRLSAVSLYLVAVYLVIQREKNVSFNSSNDQL